MQQWLLQNQLYVSLICAVLLLGMVLYRLLHTIASVSVAMLLPHLQMEPLDMWKQNWVIGRTAGMLCTVVLLVLRLLSSMWQTLWTLMLALLPVLVVSLVLVLLEARAGSSLLWLHEAMNSSAVTDLWRGIFGGLQALDTVAAYVLPAYNFVVYVVLRVPLDLLQWLWYSPGVHSSVSLAVQEIGQACSGLVPSAMAFVQANFRSDCQQLKRLQVCTAQEGALCVDSGKYAATVALCLGTPAARAAPLAANVFGHLQAASVALIQLLDEGCALAAPLLRVVLYPLLDAEMWVALDKFLNALLFLLVGMPTTTVQRCSLAPGRLSMCTPDAAPAFDMAAQGTQHLSTALNNWGDHAYAAMLGIDIPSVSGADAMLPLWKAGGSLFGSNQTSWVTLTSTTSAWTDGVSTIWVNLQGQISWRYAVANWPFPVDTRLGIAAVHLASGTEGIMGCTCTGQLTIACAILNSDDSGNSTAWTLPVTWSLPSDPTYLSCDGVRVVVQSMRWPLKRQSSQAPTAAKTCLQSGSCASADASVYVIPICGADGGKAFLACTTAFTRVSCFPYCMALRMRDSGPFALVMRGATQWESGVLLAGVDCAPSILQASDLASSALNMQISCGTTELPVTLDGMALLNLRAQELDTSPRDACAYDSTCVTFLGNRSALQRYAAPLWPQAYADTSHTAVKLQQERQPLVVGGSVQLRGYTSTSDNLRYADFPQVMGDQYNEFTMEVGLGVGVPVSTLATRAQQDQTELPAGTLWLPPAILQGSMQGMYNPATQTPDSALWYAVNPDYTSMECIARECSMTNDATGCLQISVGSTYERMSVWRVHTGQDLCYTETLKSGGSKRICSPDVASFTFLDVDKDIFRITDPNGQTEIMRTCFMGAEMNLYVESLEYFDDLNVLVAVRRGTIKDLHTRLWVGGRDAGSTVFYFVNMGNMSLVQEGRPWTLPGLLPPQLRFLPRLGDVVGLGMEAALRLMQMPTNLLLNPFALFEVMGAWPQFPSDTLYHGALARCSEGACISSLDAFFLAAHDANDAGWRVLAWMVSLLHVPAHLDKGLIESFLMGAVTAGSTQKHLQLFGIVSTAEEFFDTGIEAELLPGGRRRLLGWKGRAAWRGAKGTISGVGSGLSSGVQGIFSLSKNVVQLNLGGSPDFGILLASQDPTYLLGSHLTSFPMAWSQFTYRLLVLVVMDVLSQLTRQTGTLGTMVNGVFVRLYEAQDMFESVVQAETRQACLGLQAMLGGSASSLGRALYYNCLSAGAMGTATYQLVNIFTVDAMLYRCMCVIPGAMVDYVAYVRSTCVPLAPSSKKAQMLSMLETKAMLNADKSLVCETYAKQIEGKALTLFDPWTVFSSSAARALGDVMSDFLLNTNAGCASHTSSPYSVAMTPLPIDHFRMCGQTSLCKLRCADALNAFQAELSRVEGTTPVHAPDLLLPVTVESPFFPMFGVTSSNMQLGLAPVWALSAQPMSRCGCLNMAYCVSVAGFSLQDGNSFLVKGYCLPSPEYLTSTIRQADQWPQWTLPGLDATTLQYVEFLPSTEPAYLLVGEQLSKRQTIRVWWPEATEGTLLVDSEHIANTALTTSLLQFLNQDKPVSSSNLEVIFVGIETVFPVADDPWMVVLFLKIRLSYRAFTQGGEDQVVDSVLLHAITRWCDIKENSRCRLSAASTQYYLPCSEGVATKCIKGLDQVMTLAQGYTSLQVNGTNRYLMLPSYTFQSSSGAFMQYVHIWPNATVVLGDKLKMVSNVNERQKLGMWTQASVFSATRAVIRSPIAHNATFWLQYAPSGAMWLLEVRPKLSGYTYSLSLQSSMTATATGTLQRNCSAMSCGACTVGSVKLLCHSAQDCLLSRCIGTLVNTQSVLCGAGSVMEAMYLHMTTSWRAIYLFVVEIAFYVMRGVSGEQLTKVVLDFPTARFYELVCTTKDLFASYAALGTSMLQTLQQWLSTGLLNLDQGFDVVSEGETVAAYQYQSIGQALFNVVTASTLHPILAMHRWLLCLGKVQQDQAMLGNSIEIVFGDVTMDNSWGACESLDSVARLLNEDLLNVQETMQDLAQNMAGTVLTVVSGVSEAVIYLLKLQFEGFCTMLLSVVWSVQNMMTAFNPRKCKVPNYAQNYVLRCACGDTAYQVPQAKRTQHFDDGALWCTGSLLVPLVTGKQGIIYNPFSLDELTYFLEPTVTKCMNARANSYDMSTTCTLEGSTTNRISELVQQNVQPIDVWTRCKDNYMQKQWDVGAGAVFMDLVHMQALSDLSPKVQDMQQHAVQWATDNGILSCMREQGNFNVDYKKCMTDFLQNKLKHTPDYYYTYDLASDATALPDACLVFTGLANAPQVPKVAQKMQACLNASTQSSFEQQTLGTTTQCDLNPLLWRSSAPHLASVTKQHGSTALSKANIQDRFAVLKSRVQTYFDTFWSTWESEKAKIETAFFSADGDMVHDFLDCVFLGPYTRAEWLPCIQDSLDDARCPFYARDGAGGLDRKFNKSCLRDNLNTIDFQPPFTCGSQARRSIIKYFYRNVTGLTDPNRLNKNVTKMLEDLVKVLQANYTNALSYGCYDEVKGQCTAEACFQTPDSFNLCLDNTRNISSKQVEVFVANDILSQVKDYYKLVMQDSVPMTAIWEGPSPAQWGRDESVRALEQGLWAPDVPLVTYSASELYNLPLSSANASARGNGSVWGLCASLVGHAMMSLPLQRFEDGIWRPVNSVQLLQLSDVQSWDKLPALVRKLVDDSLQRGALHWHRSRRHIPSVSRFCTDKTVHAQWAQEERQNLHMSDPKVGDFVIRQLDTSSQRLPLFGFQWGAVGDKAAYCPCGWFVPKTKRCVLDAAVCPSNQTCLQAFCGGYAPEQADAVEDCLRQLGAGVRCPEMGPSDMWGLFPVDCGESECEAATQWVQTQFSDPMTWEGIRLLSEARAGWKLPNYAHVNATFQEALHHGQRKRPVRDFGQPTCATEAWLKEAVEEADVFAANEMVSHLFPAAQLLHESTALADCTRFLVEVARARALSHVSPARAEEAQVLVLKWQQRCHAQSRQLSMCAFLGLYYDVAPPAVAITCGSVRVADADFDTVYLTPDCVAVDRQTRRMYDAHLCVGDANTLLRVHLTETCALSPQPLSLVDGTALTRLSVEGGLRLAGDAAMLADVVLEGLPGSLLGQWSSPPPQVSEVLDWWPPKVAMPTGYHVTAATVLSELAPMLFDSHWAWDPVKYEAFYVHTALRNESALHNTVGATGLCRQHSVGMPLFDADTNRMCTRARKGTPDSPQVPVVSPLDAPGETWKLSDGYEEEFMDSFFEKEQCAASAQDVPWEPQPQDRLSKAVGALPGWYTLMLTDQKGSVSLAGDDQPVQLPLATALAAWGDNCSQVVMWGTLPPCDVVSQSQCALESTCLRLRRNDTEGVCYPVSSAPGAPCFAGHHCEDGLVCLVDGACGELYLHAWNDNAFPMEVTTLANDCGLLEKVPPYVQTTLGASPWEWVPDLLHAHGFCAHHRWFTYETGLAETDTCKAQPTGAAVCNASGPWPWAYTYLNGHTAPTLERIAKLEGDDGGVLRVRPHTCDMAFMHLSGVDNQRLKLCSATRDSSRSAANALVWQYALSDMEQPWRQKANLTHWMRTTDTDGQAILLAQTGTYTGALGFLGGVNSSADPTVRSLGEGRDSVRFFLCSDKLTCMAPPFKYNGLDRVRVGLLTGRNQSELSLRRCGPMGQLWPNDTQVEEAACLLDQPLFPVVSQAIWKPQDMASCNALWPSLLSSWVFVVESIPFTASDLKLTAGKLYCYSSGGGGCPYTLWQAGSLECQCLYLARKSHVLTDDSTDPVVQLTNLLNRVFTDLKAPDLPSLTERYEATMACFSSLAAYSKRLHGDSISGYQSAYQSLAPPGLYVVFRLALYEVPLPWMLDVALAVLVPTLMKSYPHLDQALHSAHNNFGRLQLSKSDWDTFCDQNTLQGRQRLFWLWCGSSTEHNLPQQPKHLQQQSALVADILSEIEHNISHVFGSENPDLQVTCYQQAMWRCEDTAKVNGSLASACRLSRAALNMPHSKCNNVAPNPFAQYSMRTPCESPKMYEMVGPAVEVRDLATLAPGFAFDQQNFGEYMTKVKTELVLAAQRNVVPYDYAAEIGEIGMDNPPLLHVWWPIKLDPGLVQDDKQLEDFFGVVCDLSQVENPLDTCLLSDTPIDFSDTDECVNEEHEDVDAYYHLAEFEGMTNLDTKVNVSLLDAEEGSFITLVDLCPTLPTEVERGWMQPEALKNVISQSNPNAKRGRIAGVYAPPGVRVALYGLNDDDYANLYVIWQKEQCSIAWNKLPRFLVDGVDTTEFWYWHTVEVYSWDNDGHSHSTTTGPFYLPLKITKEIFCEGTGRVVPQFKMYNFFVNFSASFDWSYWANGPTVLLPKSDDTNRICSWNEQRDVPSDKKEDQFLQHGWDIPRKKDFQRRQTQSLPLRLAWSDLDTYISNEKPASWQSKGCGNAHFAGANAVGLHFETDKLQCTAVAASKPSTKCPTTGDRWFVVGKGTTHWLWRCAPCTKYKKVVPAYNELPRMGCTFQGGMANFTQSNVDHALMGMGDPSRLESLLPAEVHAAQLDTYKNGTVVQVQSPLETPSFLQEFEQYYGRVSMDVEPSKFEGYDPIYVLSWEQKAWDYAVLHSKEPSTMYCKERAWTQEDQIQCNPKLDARRQDVAKVVQSVFRELQGVAFLQVPPHMGTAWQTTVSHPSVRLFTLMWASSARDELDVLTRRLLGSKVCSNLNGDNLQFLDRRLCVRTMEAKGFEPVHPWLGGDFDAMLTQDTCPRAGVVSYCPCDCKPQWACNHTSAGEFPEKPECIAKLEKITPTMMATDPSNLCVQASTIEQPKYCVHSQGLALSNPLVNTGPKTKVSQETLYSEAGVPLTADNHVVQGLYDASNGLWSGGVAQTVGGSAEYGFLHVPSDGMPHPGHLAFGIDAGLTSEAMVLQGIRLLRKMPSDFVPSTTDFAWLQTLSSMWDMERAGPIRDLYPQLARGDPIGMGDWSCPLREMLFWGGGHSDFAPLVPDPIVAQLLYSTLGGVHPLIAPVSLSPRLAAYTTTNGLCYFDALSPSKTSLASDPCSLFGTLQWLGLDMPAPTQVVHPFARRCMDVLDTPVLGATLRSGEVLFTDESGEKCGVLHRLSPFLMRVRGRAGRIQRIVGAYTHTTSGGDCYMGRAFLATREGPMLGARCAMQDRVQGMLRCANAAVNGSHFGRASPLTLLELLERGKLLRRVYRTSQLAMLPAFLGPGGLPLALAESSFGRLYTPSVMQTLSEDLLAICSETPGCNASTTALAATFWEEYMAGHLATASPYVNATSFSSVVTERLQDAKAARAAGLARDAAAWNQSWAWSFNNASEPPGGTVNETLWRHDRYAACNASLADYVQNHEISRSIHNIDFCTATSSTEVLCQKLDAFRTQQVFPVLCEQFGEEGDCPGNLGFFYVPSVFYPQNNEYASETVTQYYQWAVEREGGTWLQSCPQLNGLFEQQQKLRMTLKDLCPANQMEDLKLLLHLLQGIGTKLLDFAYHCFSILADFFAIFLVPQGQSAQRATIESNLQGHITTLFTALGEILPMLLDMLVRIFMELGSIGPAMQKLVEGLCVTYNGFMQYIVSWLWCFFVKPALMELLNLIMAIVSLFNVSAATTVMQSLVGEVSRFGNGKYESCYKDIAQTSNYQMTCNYGKHSYNLTATSGVSPIATMCWARSLTANSLLTCTQADTCASEPIEFAAGLQESGSSNVNSVTGAAALVPCGQCPLLDPSLNAKQFDCDVYLKRCTCNVPTTSLGECFTNADCNVPGPQCGFSTDVAHTREAFATVPCTLCAQSRLRPVCVIDGRGSGVCGCARTPGGLQMCSSELIGKSVPVYDKTTNCAVVMDETTRTHLTSYSSAPGALTWSFADIMAVAPCSLGRTALCLSVQMPVTASGDHPLPMLVLLDLLTVAQTLSWTPAPTGRRLLQATTPAQFEHVASRLQPPSHLDREEAKQQLSTNVAVAVAAMRCNLTTPPPWVTHPLYLIGHVDWSQLWDCAWPAAPAAPETRRRLLQVSSPQPVLPDPPDTETHCLLYDTAAAQMVNAFTLTAAYYAEQERRNGTLGAVRYIWPQATTELPPGVMPWLADRLFWLASMGRVGGHQFADAMLVSNVSYQEKNYLTGRRLLHELGACNFSRLLDTASQEDENRVMGTLLFLVMIFLGIQFLFNLSGFMSMLLWAGIFPTCLFWSLYGVSPLCWPMVPLQFPRDVVHAAERYLQPFVGEVPPVMMRANCTSPQKKGCMLSCQDPPFLMTSCLDVLAWWMCDWSTELCSSSAHVAERAYSWAGLHNFVSSATYYADVLAYSAQSGDADFAAAHRWCAIFASWRVLLDGCILLTIFVLLPTVLLTALDIVVAMLGFMWDTA